MDSGQDDRLAKYLDEESGVRSLSDWIWGLSRWGKTVLVRAALILAEDCVAPWRRGVPEDTFWQENYAVSTLPEEALMSVREWMARGAEAVAPSIEPCAAALRKLVESAAFYEDEASGSAELCAKRTRAVAAGRTILKAIEAVTWTEEHALQGIPDERERQAIASAGPAPKVWEAVRSYRLANGELPEAHVRERLRFALRNR